MDTGSGDALTILMMDTFNKEKALYIIPPSITGMTGCIFKRFL